MFAKAEVFQLFPTCVWMHDVADPGSLNHQLTAEIAKLEQETPVTFGGLNAWQSTDDLHFKPPFQDFCKLALASAKGALGFLKCRYDEAYITSCWANVNRQGYSHRDHVHPNNLLSGVSYVKIPARSGSIVFSDPRPQAHVLAPSVKEYTNINSNEYRIEAQAGRLVLFPSWLQHMVETNQSNEERISIAFNVMLKGPVGVEMARAVL